MYIIYTLVYMNLFNAIYIIYNLLPNTCKKQDKLQLLNARSAVISTESSKRVLDTSTVAAAATATAVTASAAAAAGNTHCQEGKQRIYVSALFTVCLSFLNGSPYA